MLLHAFSNMGTLVSMVEASCVTLSRLDSIYSWRLQEKAGLQPRVTVANHIPSVPQRGASRRDAFLEHG